MSFVFWGGDEAETEFKKDLTFFYEKHGYKGSYPKAQTEEVWTRLRAWSSNSETACAIFQFIDSSDKDVHVVGMSRGFQCFSSTSGVDEQKGTIFVDLDAKIMILAETTHNFHLPMTTMARLWKGSVGGQTWVDLDNNVTLLHEMGHAKQWIEKPGWFDKDYRTETKKVKGQAPRDDDPKLKDVSAAEIRNKAKIMAVRTAIKSYPAGRTADLSFLPDASKETGGQQLETPVGWGVPIEHDNMRRHEWPVCREMGLPLRCNYGDIRLGNSAPAQQLTTMMKRWAEEEAAKKTATMSERTGAVTKGAYRGKVECPKCKKMVGKMALNFPCEDSRMHA
jgi:hypothetical protein